jgi:mRNA degradation ribonuclease J1/J2
LRQDIVKRGIGHADGEENGGADNQSATDRREMRFQGQSTVILLANIMPKLAFGPSMKVCSLSFCAVAVPSLGRSSYI